MAILVKICGINIAEAADAAVRAGADFGGLVFHPEIAASSCRWSGARRWPSACAGGCGWWRWWPMPTTKPIAASLDAVKPDFLQLHGSETPDARGRDSRPLRRAGDQGHRRRRSRRSCAGAALTSSRCRHVPVRRQAAERRCAPGGHGAPFDWQLLRGRKFSPALAAGRRPHARQRRARHRASRRARRGCLVGRRNRARRQRAPQLIADFVAAARKALSRRRAHERCPIPSAPVPTSAAISAPMAGASSPKR